MNAIKVENLLKIAFHFHFRRFTSTIENKMQITEGCQYELSSVFWTIQKWRFYQRTYVENLKYRPGSPQPVFISSYLIMIFALTLIPFFLA